MIEKQNISCSTDPLSIIDTRGLETGARQIGLSLTESLSVSYHAWIVATSADLSTVPCFGWRLVPSHLRGPGVTRTPGLGPWPLPAPPGWQGPFPLPRSESPRDSLQALGTELQATGLRFKGAPGPGQDSAHTGTKEPSQLHIGGCTMQEREAEDAGSRACTWGCGCSP